MRKTRNLARFAAATMALVLVAAACGDDDDSDAGGATTTAAAATTTEAATTTAGGATTTEGGATTTAAAGGETLQVDTANCPEEATTALADGAELKIGTVLPQTGNLAFYGPIAQGMQAYFDKVNAEDGGVDGHELALIAKDDAYDPNKTPPLVTELIEQEQVMATMFQIGTPNVVATRGLYESSCTPQLFVGTGFPQFGDPAGHPWTIGGILPYNTEAVMWGEFIEKVKPGAKVAQLVFNNDFGKTYQASFEAVAEEKGFEIVETKLHEGTAANIDNEVTAILASNPDVVIGETAGAFCPRLLAGLAQGGYQGITIMPAVCTSVAQVFKPVDPAGDKAYTLITQKDPTDPAYAEDPAVKQYIADIEQYGAGADINSLYTATGYNAGATIVEILTQAAEMEGGLTRANIMNAAWSLDFAGPLLLGGQARLNGIDDAYAIEYAEMFQYDAAKGSLVSTGEIFDAEGKTGVYQAG